MTCMSISTQKAEALELWAQRIASIVNPGRPAKVVKLRRRRR